MAWSDAVPWDLCLDLTIKFQIISIIKQSKNMWEKLLCSSNHNYSSDCDSSEVKWNQKQKKLESLEREERKDQE